MVSRFDAEGLQHELRWFLPPWLLRLLWVRFAPRRCENITQLESNQKIMKAILEGAILEKNSTQHHKRSVLVDGSARTPGSDRADCPAASSGLRLSSRRRAARPRTLPRFCVELPHAFLVCRC